MSNQDFSTAIEVAASADHVFRHINEVAKWWMGGMEGASQRLGDVFTMRFGDTFVTHRIVEFVPGSKVVWQVTDCNLHWIDNKKEWLDTRIVFEIMPAGGNTRILFTHLGLKPGIECYEDCSKGWNYNIKESLFSFITSGKGKPENT